VKRPTSRLLLVACAVVFAAMASGGAPATAAPDPQTGVWWQLHPAPPPTERPVLAQAS